MKSSGSLKKTGMIPWARPTFWGHERSTVADALRSSWISGGPYVEKFERDFARLHGVKYCITASSGTSALYLALLAIGVTSADEVILPGFGFMAAAHMVMAAGARPVFADIDRDTWCIAPHEVRRSLSRKTKAVVAIHTYGNVCDMESLGTMAAQHGFFLIEDAAESLFSRYGNRPSGTFGDIGCFSFQAAKTITTGEGGCVVTSSRKLYTAMHAIRNHGMVGRRKYWHDCIGHNFRLTNIQAALGYAQLQCAPAIIRAKRKVYENYARFLKDEDGITLQLFRPGVDPVVWCVAVRIDPCVFHAGRDTVMKRLRSAGIETRPGFYPPSVMPLYKASRVPVAEHIGLSVITLPSFPSIARGRIRYICETLKELRRKKR